MTDDIVARLRGVAHDDRPLYQSAWEKLAKDAADEIERLRAELEDLRKFKLDVMREAIQRLPPVGKPKEATSGSR